MKNKMFVSFLQAASDNCSLYDIAIVCNVGNAQYKTGVQMDRPLSSQELFFIPQTKN